jgi:hypothetical protein
VLGSILAQQLEKGHPHARQESQIEFKWQNYGKNVTFILIDGT